MTDKPQQPEHCRHEEVCEDNISYLKSVLDGKYPVMKCKDAMHGFNCPYDTRTKTNTTALDNLFFRETPPSVTVETAKRREKGIIGSRPAPAPHFSDAENQWSDGFAAGYNRCKDEQSEAARAATLAENKRVLNALIGKIDNCINSCPSEARQKPKTVLRYVRATCESLRQAGEQR
jgi:hypothetical protein